MHPSNFFGECHIKTGIDVVEIFDNDLKIKITMPVYKINLSYMTEKNNYKTVNRYAVMDSNADDEYIDFWIDMFVRDYNNSNPKHKMVDCKINNIKQVCEAVLPIG